MDSQISCPYHGRVKKAFVYIPLCLCAAAGAWFRVRGIFTDLWFDEIVSFNLARSLSSPLEIFRIYFDNNHILNTAYLYLTGFSLNWWSMRLLSLFSGIGTLGIVFFVLRELRRKSYVITLLLFSLSYLLIVYSSEARGYAPAVFCAMLSWLFLLRYLNSGGAAVLAGFWVSAAAGAGFHPSFVGFYGSLVFWSWFRISGAGSERKLSAWIRLHLFPALSFILYYLFFIRKLPPGSGPVYGYFDEIVESLSLAAGGPQLSDYWQLTIGIALSSALAGLTVAVLELYYLYKEKNDLWLFYFLAVFAAPVASLILFNPRVLYPRYFLINIVFLYFVWGGFLTRMYVRGEVRRILSVLMIVLYFIGNGINLHRFYRFGRGGYLEALYYIQNNSDSRKIVVSSDHPVRNWIMIDYYQRFLAPGKALIHKDVMEHDCNSQWLIEHNQDLYYEPGSREDIGCGTDYVLVKTFPYSGLSGWNWYLYRKKE